MRVRLDGVLLDENAGAGWALAPGVAPYAHWFQLPTLQAEQIFAAAQPHASVLELDASEDTGKIRKVEKLSVLRIGPTSLPYMSTLQVADRRWSWGYDTVRLSVNVRARTGNRRRGPGGNLANVPIADDLGYKPWSLREGQPWRAVDLLTYLLDRVAGSGNWTIRELPSGADALQAPQLDLFDPGRDCLARAMASLGSSVDIFVDYDGTVVVYDRLSGRERELVGAQGVAPGKGYTDAQPAASDPNPGGTRTREQQAAAQQQAAAKAPGIGPPIEGNYPLWVVSDRRRERPSKVRVLFTRLVELRLDYREGGTDTVRETSDPKAVVPPRLANVAPAPRDLTLGQRSVVTGTWVTLGDLLSAQELQATPGGGTLPALTLDVVRRAFEHGSVLTEYANKLDSAPLWPRVVAALRAHYRATFRLQRPWRDRIREYREYLLAVLDQETQGRAPAQAYVDHAVWQGFRSLGSKRLVDADAFHQIYRNVPAHPTAGLGQVVGQPLAALQPGPFTVRVVDQDQGILQVAPSIDANSDVLQVYRSAFDTIPTDKPGERLVLAEQGNLTEEHQLAVLLTVVPAVPNDERQLHAVEVGPAEAAARLGVQDLGPCEGPVMAVAVAPNAGTARFGWDDARETQVHEGFAEGGDPAAALGDPLNADELAELARAVATRIYSGLLDRPEGGLTTALAPDARLLGTARAIRHRVNPDEGAVTSVEIPAEAPPVDLLALLPTSLRKIVLGEVDP